MIQEKLQPYQNLIKEHAQVALKKLRKPTNHTLEDLVSEGIVVFFETKRSYMSNRGSSFKTFLIRNLRNHYRDMVVVSYRHSNKMIQDYSNQVKNEDHLDISELEIEFLISKLSKRERAYVKILQSASPSLKLREKRAIARKMLGLSNYCEVFLRKDIATKLTREVVS
jgi:DNA-directed RNA polymerase specialized sigma24 family protein